MPKALNVPWDEIRKAVEKGTSLSDVARLFDIKLWTIQQRSHRHNWQTPKRVKDKLEKALGMQGHRAAENASLAEQIKTAEAAEKPGRTSTTGPLDFDRATKDYRTKGVAKMAKLLDQTIISPPRNWKDFDIADKMMRRLLGIDDADGRNNTIVQLQVVNERLKTSMQDEIIEGEFIENEAESVTEASPLPESLCETTGS
jgi:hypothetical protein